MREKNWDIYEVVLLIEAYHKIESGEDRFITLQNLSQELRQLALNGGYEIDDKFRNLNGVQWQMGFIRLAFNRAEFESRKPPKIFIEGVELYKNNREEFFATLKTARAMLKKEKQEMVTESTKTQFIEWLRNYEEKKCAEPIFLDLFEKVSDYAVKYNISRTAFWSITNFKQFNAIRVKLSGSKIFKFTHPKLFSFIEKWGKLYTVFLKDKYPIEEVPKPSVHIEESIVIEPVVVEPKNIEPIVEEPTIVEPSVVEEKAYNVETAFSKWMLNEQGLSESSSRSYLGSLRTANEYALDHSIWEKSIFSLNGGEIVDAVKKLLSNEDFLVYNVEQHNRFSAALKQYVIFQCGDNAALPLGGRRTRRKKEMEETVVDRTEYSDGIYSLLENHYKFGFRLNSPIEIMKIRKYAEQDGVSLPDDDEKLRSEIRIVGFLIEDKVFVFGKEKIDALSSKFSEIFDKGFNMVFFDSFMDKENEWLTENHILTSELLKELLGKGDRELFFAKNFVAANGKITEIDGIIQEVKSIWGEDVLMSYDTMRESLPYVPEDKLAHALSVSEEIVWVSIGMYTCLEKVNISYEDEQNIIAFVENSCELRGYASINDAPLKRVIEENFELSITAIHEAVYTKILKGKYYINGKILTKTQGDLDAVTLVKAYCADKDECSFEELYNRVIELTGASNRQTAFEAGYDAMVRVEENRFVADKFVSFDVLVVDELLDEIIQGDFIPIRAVGTFARFPICGQAWSHYLLESFCHRFSDKFSLNVLNFNDKNAGIISRKSTNLTYRNMLAIALARSGIDLTVETAGKYLFNNGYLAKSKYSSLGEIVEEAKGLR